MTNTTHLDRLLCRDTELGQGNSNSLISIAEFYTDCTLSLPMIQWWYSASSLKETVQQEKYKFLIFLKNT